MRKVKWIIKEKTIEKDEIGQITESFKKTGEVWTGYALPPSFGIMSSNIREWGFDPSKVLETYTREPMNENAYIEKDGEIFHVVKVLNYVRYNRVFLEKVKRDG